MEIQLFGVCLLVLGKLGNINDGINYMWWVEGKAIGA